MAAATNFDLPAALSGERHSLESAAGRLAYYVGGPSGGDAPPLLLIHSVNAAGTAYEVKPLYEHYRERRTVYALELPGFGFSDRSERLYTPRLMTDAVLAMIAEIRRRHGDAAFDALALSLASEFLARAASENASAFRTVALVSPTGFDKTGPRNGPPGSTRAMPALHATFAFPLWARPFYNLLTSKISIRFFLQKTWGSKNIDEGLFEYDYLTARQRGAEHAPFYFVSGYLFSNDISRVYQALTMPVWMSHGVRGDFVDYSRKQDVEARPNWTIDVFQTGALPHFEMLASFTEHYDRFLTAA